MFMLLVVLRLLPVDLIFRPASGAETGGAPPSTLDTQIATDFRVHSLEFIEAPLCLTLGECNLVIINDTIV